MIYLLFLINLIPQEGNYYIPNPPVSPLADFMHEKVCWTMSGRKKVFLVDENNKVIKELRDLGPLSKIEMRWVKSNSGMPYAEWLKTQDQDEEAAEENEA
jgi:hypothetical protein